ncbi:RagB/SusD family nutrient uptake outer membrane protein [Niabella sp.]|uniref:RagB/SusD family nutrient uptake outer membrane protein n=1 Tax=Niabella sp. TaxID=1962976 RepID=UPI002633E049|nr:RagB/SusD family nutrient uptake outer membrane protein [Niabella sp.]
MKNIFLILCTVLIASCSIDRAGLLDKQESGDLNEALVFSSALYTKQFLTDIYRRLPYGWDDNVYLDAATDDGEARPWWGWVNQIHTGAWNPTSVPDKLKRWSDYYAAIRACNLFLSKIDNVPVDAEQYMSSEEVRTRMKYEAVCLRALFYADLVRYYGGVPIITKVLDRDSPELFTPRANLQQMKEFIIADCDSAAAYLPSKQLSADYHRVGASVAKAIKARLLLELASPLFNSTESGPLSPWSWGNYDANRWKEAADAAKDLIDYKDPITGKLVSDLVYLTTTDPNYLNARNSYPGSLKAMGFYSVFVTRVNSEILLSFSRKGATTNELDKWQLPGSMQTEGDKSYTEPTYNYAAAFETKDGYPVYLTDDDGQYIIDPATNEFAINPKANFNPQKPYDNRDSRFYHSIWYQGSKFSNVTFEAWRAADGSYGRDYQVGYAHTGLFLRKFMDPKNISTGSNNPGVLSGGTSHCFPLFRLAEFVLGAAEALNEFLPDGADRSEVIAQMDKIRLRADMPDVKTTALRNGWNTTDKAAMRKFIRNERRVELAFEEHRFFDIRRWKIGEKTQRSAYVHDVLKDKTNNTFTYTIKLWERRIYESRHNLLPIPQTEVNNNPNMVQNPGW